MMGYAFLMFAGGLNSLIIPIRGNSEGFSAFSLGLLGTSWAIGFILGSFTVPKMVQRVGHIRIFAVMASLATLAVILSSLWVNSIVWLPLRAAAGFCFAGAAMIVESWLNESANKNTRGRIFGVYTMVNLVATTAGQMVIVTGDTTGIIFFLIAAMFYTLAIIPPSLSEQTKPRPLRQVTFDLPLLWKSSPVAVVGVMLIGISNGAFGSLGAVYAQRIDLDIAAVATFMSAAIIAGAAAQMPIGYMSDKFDRRTVLAGLALVASVIDVFFIQITEIQTWMIIAAGAAFGGAIYSLPPVIMAHANDQAPRDKYVQTSSGLLLIFGLGAIIGPIVGGTLMSAFGESGLFMATLWSHLTLAVYVLWRKTRRKSVSKDEKIQFERIEPGRVILQTPPLSARDFGVSEARKGDIPDMPEHIRSAFDRKIEDSEMTDLQKRRGSDKEHGGW